MITCTWIRLTSLNVMQKQRSGFNFSVTISTLHCLPIPPFNFTCPKMWSQFLIRFKLFLTERTSFKICINMLRHQVFFYRSSLFEQLITNSTFVYLFLFFAVFNVYAITCEIITHVSTPSAFDLFVL